MTSVCEACMSHERLLSLNESARVEGDVHLYVDMFLACFNLQIVQRQEDASLHFVCEYCAERLTEATKFRTQVIRTQALLAQARLIKREDPEEFDISLDYALDRDGPPETKLEVKLDEDASPANEVSTFWLKREDNKEDVFTEITPRRKRKYTKRVKGEKKRDIKKQKQDVPMDVKTLTCKLCDKSFENIVILQRHMAAHFPEHLCDICGSVFRKWDHLRVHLKTHTTVQCKECNKIVKEGSLKNHLEHYHKSKKLYYMCSVCYEKFPSLSQKRTHMKNSHGVDVGGKCNLCDKSFTFKSNLRLHIRSVHQKEVNTFCQHCGKGFLNEYALTRHMLKHTGVRNHECQICHKAYLKKDTLTAHMKIHNSVKDFVCSLCAKSFTYKCSLKGHMKTHHPHVNFEG